jgi:hypothetical protein
MRKFFEEMDANRKYTHGFKQPFSDFKMRLMAKIAHERMATCRLKFKMMVCRGVSSCEKNSTTISIMRN